MKTDGTLLQIGSASKQATLQNQDELARITARLCQLLPVGASFVFTVTAPPIVIGGQPIADMVLITRPAAMVPMTWALKRKLENEDGAV